VELAGVGSCFFAGWEPIAYDPLAALLSHKQDLRLGKCAKELVLGDVRAKQLNGPVFADPSHPSGCHGTTSLAVVNSLKPGNRESCLG
jgi:hypothetical protein